MQQYKYNHTLSSGGKQTTINTNQSIIFEDANGNNIECPYVAIESFGTSFTVSINDETVIHEIDSNSGISFEDIPIYKLTIHESGVEYRWSALY